MSRDCVACVLYATLELPLPDGSLLVKIPPATWSNGPLQGVSTMFAMFRFLFLVFVIFVGVGIYRGWFSFTTPTQLPDNKMNFNITVDENAVKADTDRLRARIAQEVAQRANQGNGGQQQPQGSWPNQPNQPNAWPNQGSAPVQYNQNMPQNNWPAQNQAPAPAWPNQGNWQNPPPGAPQQMPVQNQWPAPGR